MATGRERFMQGAFIRMFRIWAASRACALDDYAAMEELSDRLDLPPQAAAACASFFALVESRLGRGLMAERCCSQRLSADEEALVRLITLAPDADVATTTDQLPHGLPSAICWAAGAVRLTFSFTANATAALGIHSPSRTCPFEPIGTATEAAHGL